MEGRNVYDARKHIGEVLAEEAPVDGRHGHSGARFAACPRRWAIANAANIPFELGIIRNHYVGRTFIEPSDRIRHLGVRLKHNPNRAMLKGKKVVLVDDSIVRGTTSKKIVEMVRDAGATEVHFRVASPPTTHSCFYGVDTPNTDDLLAHRMDVEEHAPLHRCRQPGLHFHERALPRHGQRPARDPRAPGFCDACFSGEYPIALTDISGGGTRPPAVAARRRRLACSKFAPSR